MLQTLGIHQCDLMRTWEPLGADPPTQAWTGLTKIGH